jgi:hypothetical protein
MPRRPLNGSIKSFPFIRMIGKKLRNLHGSVTLIRPEISARGFSDGLASVHPSTSTKLANPSSLSLAVVALWIGKQHISACKQASFVLVLCDQPACYITVYLNRPKIIGKNWVILLGSRLYPLRVRIMPLCYSRAT